MREQRTSGSNNRRSGLNNYSMNNPRPNQRFEQAQFTLSRSSDQPTNNRQQQYRTRNHRFTDNRSPHEGRDSPSQMTNDETIRAQRISSGSFSQGQNSSPTSPSTAVPARTIYSTNNRSLIGRNSPAPYTSSSSSRNNSLTATSPASTTTLYQTSSTVTGNYSQQSNNRMAKKSSYSKDILFIILFSNFMSVMFKDEQQSTNDELDQPKQPRHQQQTSSNNSSNTVSLNRPSQLHTQQTKQAQQTSLSNNNIPSSLTLSTQDDHSSSHESINPSQPDQTMHITDSVTFTQHTVGTMYTDLFISLLGGSLEY